MNIAVPKEIMPGERRVAATPETVARMVKAGLNVAVETGAGGGAFLTDADYEKAGARIVTDPTALLADADVVLKVQRPTFHEVDLIREGAVLIAMLGPLSDLELIKKLAERKITAFALELIPRITRAQMMDSLSSQATMAGYYAVILAAQALPKLFPMLMTAAGTIAPAKVLVLGAGVAGLQAIATARRLGALVEAFDVRKVVKEQVESLGAKFVEVDMAEDAHTASGYAKEVSEEYRRKQAELLHRHLAKADVCITTALIPGQRAPLLITEEMVRAMNPGSVIVDLAADQGGNCALTEPGSDVVKHGVTIIGPLNLPSRVAVHASQTYARNMEKFLLLVQPGGELKINFDDEIIRDSAVTHLGEIVHPTVKTLLARDGNT